ncbi:MAG: iron ABC transporter permease [Anaerolineaceae bacterium]|nr:iron ABC transporter permease [Anaerolineaceae bacterium]
MKPTSGLWVKQHQKIFLLLILLLVMMAASIFIGRYPKPFWMPIHVLIEDDMAQRLVWLLRLPRILTAALLGATLAVCGTVLQMIFRNPIVEPGFLGVSQGAAFGAAVAILWLGGGRLTVELSASLFALLGLAGSFILARTIKFGGWVLRLILSGIVVSALFSSGLGVLKYLADPLTQLQEITFWLLGGLWSVTWKDLLYVAPVVLIGLLVVYLMRWRLNVLALGQDTAFSLGAETNRERLVLLIAAVSATAVLTALSGIVGWIGLIVPQITRQLFGPSGQFTVPGSMLIGAIFGVVCDNLARTLLAGEIPLGILTSLIGALLFVVIINRSRIKLR